MRTPESKYLVKFKYTDISGSINVIREGVLVWKDGKLMAEEVRGFGQGYSLGMSTAVWCKASEAISAAIRWTPSQTWVTAPYDFQAILVEPVHLNQVGWGVIHE